MTERDYWYGFKFVNNKSVPFIFRKKEMVPENYIELSHLKDNSENIEKIYTEYVKTIKSKSVNKEVTTKSEPIISNDMFMDGEICLKEGSIAHTVIVMHQFHNGMANMLVLTSNPNWNPNCRSTTREELAWFRHTGNKNSYIAPYHDDTGDLISTGSCIGELSYNNLRKEFDGKFLSENRLRKYHQVSRKMKRRENAYHG